MSYEKIIHLSQETMGEDRYGNHRKFVNLVRFAKRMVPESHVNQI
jgi:hypothetical protein